MAKLYIICGHGAGDPGATGNGYKEAERVRALGSRLAALGGAEVELLDTSRNWYADGGLNRLKIPAGACVLELHMDSDSTGKAKGGHVIISAKFNADKYDKALAAFIAGYFPGRSASIKKRSDLANVNRAAKRGLNFRLLETCFISNAQDVAKFNANLDKIATGILAAFDIHASAKPASESSSSAAAKKPAASTAAKKTVAQLADEVIAGKWGSGAERQQKLSAAGYDYSAVQAAVNEKLGAGTAKKASKSIETIAREVIEGKWGNGADRKKRLQAAGYDYAAVQKKVNQLLK